MVSDSLSLLSSALFPAGSSFQPRKAQINRLYSCKVMTERVNKLLLNTVEDYAAKEPRYFPQESVKTKTELKRENIRLPFG